MVPQFPTSRCDCSFAVYYRTVVMSQLHAVKVERSSSSINPRRTTLGHESRISLTTPVSNALACSLSSLILYISGSRYSQVGERQSIRLHLPTPCNVTYSKPSVLRRRHGKLNSIVFPLRNCMQAKHLLGW